jgi:hypothetical protein
VERHKKLKVIKLSVPDRLCDCMGNSVRGPRNLSFARDGNDRMGLMQLSTVLGYQCGTCKPLSHFFV